MNKILLSVFFFCLFACATLFVLMFWREKPSEEIFRVGATLFVVGLTSFLVWFVFMLKNLGGRDGN
jgi:uncharacterized membrane protein